MKNTFLKNTHASSASTSFGVFAAGFVKIGLAFLFFYLVLHAGATANSPSPEEELQRQQQRLQDLRQKLEVSSGVRLQRPVSSDAKQLPTNETPCFQIQKVTFSSALPEFGDLTSVLSAAGGENPPQAVCLGAQGIQILIDRLQNHLISQGFVTTRVQAPAQDLKSGELVFNVLPGRLNQVRWQTARGVTRLLPLQTLGQALALPLRQGQVLNLRAIEQALENLKRGPSADADIQIAPSELAEHSDLVIRFNPGKPIRLSLSVDDAGSKTTGKYQGTSTVFLVNVLGLNEQFYFNMQRELGGKDPGERGTRGQVAHLSVPLGYWQLSWTSSQNRYFQDIFNNPVNPL